MNPKQRLEYWQVFDNFRKSREALYTPKIAKALNGQKSEFIEQFKQGNRTSFILNSTPLATIIKDLYLDAGKNFGDRVRINLNKQKGAVKSYNKAYEVKRRMPIGFNARMQELIKQYYGLDFLNMSADISETTRDILQKVLIQAQADGLGFDDIVKQLENTELSRSRARLIARTETVSAANSGAILSAKESGILVKKVWIATQDNRTRDDHYRVSTEAIDVDEAFKVGVYDMMQPGARKQPNGLPVPPKEICNCRCCVAFSPVRDASGRVLTA